MTTILGIDPGTTGAIGMVTPMVDTWDMPATPKDLADLFARFDPNTTRVYVEAVHSMPGQGVASSFTFGQGYGVILGVLAAYGFPHRLVAPATWKRAMGVTSNKDACRRLAQQLFPTAALARKRDDGRAEALLIAEWGRRQG